jgi:hypothetical protein
MGLKGSAWPKPFANLPKWTERSVPVPHLTASLSTTASSALSPPSPPDPNGDSASPMTVSATAPTAPSLRVPPLFSSTATPTASAPAASAMMRMETSRLCPGAVADALCCLQADLLFCSLCRSNPSCVRDWHVHGLCNCDSRCFASCMFRLSDSVQVSRSREH